MGLAGEIGNASVGNGLRAACGSHAFLCFTQAARSPFPTVSRAALLPKFRVKNHQTLSIPPGITQPPTRPQRPAASCPAGGWPTFSSTAPCTGTCVSKPSFSSPKSLCCQRSRAGCGPSRCKSCHWSFTVAGGAAQVEQPGGPGAVRQRAGPHLLRTIALELPGRATQRVLAHRQYLVVGQQGQGKVVQGRHVATDQQRRREQAPKRDVRHLLGGT